MNMGEFVNNLGWYNNLIEDIKLLESIGKRILDDDEKFGKPEWGSKRVENIAKDVGCGKRDLEKCIQFARQFLKDHSVECDLKMKILNFNTPFFLKSVLHKPAILHRANTPPIFKV